MIVIDDNINDKGQIDDGKRWQSTRTLDVGTGTPNESNDPYYGHLKMTWTKENKDDMEYEVD